MILLCLDEADASSAMLADDTTGIARACGGARVVSERRRGCGAEVRTCLLAVGALPGSRFAAAVEVVQ